MNDFVSWCRHLLVPFLFHVDIPYIPYIPLHFIEMIFTLVELIFLCFGAMKGDVGMSSHEKEREQEDAYTKTESHSCREKVWPLCEKTESMVVVV